MRCFLRVESTDTRHTGGILSLPDVLCRLWQEPGVLQNIPISDHWLLLARVTKTHEAHSTCGLVHCQPRRILAIVSVDAEAM